MRVVLLRLVRRLLAVNQHMRRWAAIENAMLILARTEPNPGG